MKTRFLIFICIAVFVTSSLMVIAYTYPESFDLTRPYSEIGEYDGTVSEIALMIDEQCSNKNQFSDYPFTKTSNGHYYIDNVICERINVEQGGCLEPFSKGFPDETCRNRLTFDYPYGETGPYFSKEFCNQVKSWEPALTDTVENKRVNSEWLQICIIRGLIEDTSWVLLPVTSCSYPWHESNHEKTKQYYVEYRNIFGNYDSSDPQENSEAMHYIITRYYEDLGKDILDVKTIFDHSTTGMGEGCNTIVGGTWHLKIQNTDLSYFLDSGFIKQKIYREN
ncbi:hypothetical protein [Nitrosopumilus adriaticus]|uniref:Uncharacterized protein n=1 Tax=Nitrosopumilus adriaticus TaxID=1580092 RepID=A0A0D5C1W2_9ARCH|nr:hypothetical protein [Nitrosopumilus adriaticus]AJW70305.1 exported protein of unknown function [Nitrosopumilus adriaticus]